MNYLRIDWIKPDNQKMFQLIVYVTFKLLTAEIDANLVQIGSNLQQYLPKFGFH